MEMNAADEWVGARKVQRLRRNEVTRSWDQHERMGGVKPTPHEIGRAPALKRHISCQCARFVAVAGFNTRRRSPRETRRHDSENRALSTVNLAGYPTASGARLPYETKVESIPGTKRCSHTVA